MERPYEKMIRYCKVATMASDSAEKSPTSECQFDLANMLRDELIAMGASDVYLDETCIVYAKIPATPGLENAPKVGFISHVDTVPEFNGVGVEPIVHENYDGKDIPLPKGGRTLLVSDFPYLKDKVGKTIITASGDTLLGADDKAGVAEIMCLCEKLLQEDTPHGTVCVAFTPDEEVGLGTDNFDLERFGADYAFTVDGGPAGEVVAENFNAGSATVHFNGLNVHPGSAKDVMINASLVAMEFNAMLPSLETPAHTEGHEGYFHVMYMKGDIEQARLYYIVRDHDAQKLEYRRQTMELIVKLLNEKYRANTVSLEWKYGYRNMKEKVDEHPEIVESAIRAVKKTGLEPIIVPIRGGTDGAALTERGLLCPNLGMGAGGYHGPFEHAIAEDMELCTQILWNITQEAVADA